MWRRWIRTLLAMSCCAGGAAAAAPADEPCPSGLPAATRCALLHDSEGAYVWFAVPKAWNGVLVVHAHGGPELGPPEPRRGAEDLRRWSVMVQAGYAWVGSTDRKSVV